MITNKNRRSESSPEMEVFEISGRTDLKYLF
jgi:hypothetical protein